MNLRYSKGVYFHVLAILGVDVGEALDVISSPFIGQKLSWEVVRQYFCLVI